MKTKYTISKKRVKKIEGDLEKLIDTTKRMQELFDSLQDDQSVIVRQVAHMEDAFETETGASPHDTGADITYLEVPIIITADQAKSMSDGGAWLMGWDKRNGWLLLGNPLYAADNEGNGCWHDLRGNEQHGPHGT